jgi:hypothetical protein
MKGFAMGDTCFNCKYFRAAGGAKQVPLIGEPAPGLCVRFPPTMIANGQGQAIPVPTLAISEGYCGEHRTGLIV